MGSFGEKKKIMKNKIKIRLVIDIKKKKKKDCWVVCVCLVYVLNVLLFLARVRLIFSLLYKWVKRDLMVREVGVSM